MRYHATAEGDIPFTPEEEAEFDAEIAANAAKPKTLRASDIIGQLTHDEALKLVALLELREVITPEKATKLREGK